MFNNPLTPQDLLTLASASAEQKLGGLNLPEKYVYATPVTGSGFPAWRLFDAAYISTGIIDPNRLGSGATGAGNLYLADDGTWKPVSSIGGSQNLQQVTDLGNTTTNAITVGGLISTTGDFTTSGNVDTVEINHTSGSGRGLIVTKDGSGEGIYVNKTSGSGNAVTVVGTLEATTLKKTGGTSSQFLKADGSVDSNSYLTSVPTLAQVTTAGNTTTNAITVGGLTVATNLIYTDTVNGRVGIGTTSPTRTLTVNGAILVPNNTGYYTKNTSGSELAVFLADTSNNIQYGSVFFGGGSIFYTATLYDWYQYPSSVGTHRMRLASSGNLLIGTTTDAGYKLDVVGNSRVQGSLNATLSAVTTAYLVNYNTSTGALTYGNHFNTFGLGVTSLGSISGDNLNNGSDVRFFQTHTTTLNTPSTITSFGMGLQMQFQPNNAVQLITSRLSSDPLYMRKQSNSTWSSWVRIWDENAFTSTTISNWTDAYNRWAGVGYADFNSIASNQFFTGHTSTVNYPPNSDQSFISGISSMYNTTSGWMIATSRTSTRPLSYRKVSNGTWSSWYDIIAANSSGNVGIGTSNPTYRVDVQGTTLATSTISTQGAFNINPLAAPPAIGGYTLAAGTNLGVGTYYYFVVYVTALGETSAGANLTVVTTTGNTTVNLTGIPVSSDPRVTARKLYRTLVGQTSDAHRFLATISDNVTTTYTDSATDASLTGVALQYYKVNTTSRYFTVAGVQGMVIDTNLTALGRNAGGNIISTSGAAIRTVLIGAQAGQSITTGQANVIVGVAGASITTGSNNTLIGDIAGYGITTGYDNTFLGGDGVGRYVTTGYRNTFIGNQAGRNLNDGTSQFTVGFENIAIGNRARMFANNNSNSIVIGSNALGLGTNTTVLGNSSTTFTSIPAGNLAVGSTTNAGYKLDVNGTLRTVNSAYFATSSGTVSIGTTTTPFKFTLIDGSATYVAQFRGSNSSYIVVGDTSLAGESGLNARNSVGQLFLGIGPSAEAYFSGTSGATALNFSLVGVSRIYVNSSGNVGINTTSPIYRLDVNGTTRFTGNAYVASGELLLDNNQPFKWKDSGGTARRAMLITAANDFQFGPVDSGWGGQTYIKAGGIIQLIVNGASGTSNPALTVFTTGNTSIGNTTDSGYKLDITGTTRLGGATTITGAANITNTFSLNGIDQTSFGFMYPYRKTLTLATATVESWYKVATTNTGIPHTIKLKVSVGGDNDFCNDEFIIGAAGYNMPMGIMMLPSTRYNNSKLLEIRAINTTNATVEIWIRVAANTGATDITTNATVLLENLVGTTIAPTNTTGSTAMIISPATRNQGLNLSRGIVAGGDITANSFIKSGGTSSQFLKADGSIDSNTYLTSVTNITGNAGTATTLQTARNINGTSFNGSGNITTAVWGNARTLRVGNTGKSVDGSGNVSWTLGEIQAEYQVPTNTLRNNLGDPTVREMAMFHGQFNNKFRFISPTLQEESTDGVAWTTSTRASAGTLGDMMRGEGEGTSFNAIPTGTIGTYGGYRLTWNVVGTVGYIFLNALYVFNSTNGNNVTIRIEAYHNTNGWTTITGPHTVNNWPGHAYIPHSNIPYSNNASQYSQVRITFETTHNAYTNAFGIYSIEWVGGYPQGKRNAESWDRNKNVTFPGIVYATGGSSSNWNTAYTWGNHASAGYQLAATAITTSNIASQSVSYASTSAESGRLSREDNRMISPSELTAGSLKFGFTSWANDNSSPYADFLHLRSYTDASGGSDNLVMFKKTGLGMRIWQQTWGSATAYSSYVDVWTTGDFTSTTVTNWNTAYTNRITSLTTTGSSGAATLVSNVLNIPNYTLVGLGYSVPTLTQVTTAGNSTTNSITVGGLTVDTDTLVVDATNNRVGIGTSTPTDKLHIVDANNANIFGRITANGTNASAAWVAQNNMTDNVVYRVFGSGVTGSQMGISLVRSASLMANLGGTGAFLIGTYSGSDLVFGTANVENMRISNNTGNLLIGTTTDVGNMLDVAGTINGGSYSVGNVPGWTGTINIMSNPPGMQNISVQSGIIVNVF